MEGIDMDAKERRVPAWARRVGLSLCVAAGIAGGAAAQSGTITFQGAITEPSCGFEADAQGVNATCLTPAGRPVSKALRAAALGKAASARVGAAQLRLEPIGRRGATNTYVVVATYL
ncbi:hypothetical protein C2U69_33370 [Cupriavidus pinatubonensis]|uniref:Type 1 fimbrial protein n=2 Tax=Burkholderiaceae TaxID=119060 RepID=Q46RY8_CUPPJ|nr:hypothetical protein C2U69_33370 [Cupriavidus pinatubonensis]